MQVWRDLDEVKGVDRSIVTIGTFDGVHRGHQHVIDRVVARANETGDTSVVITFDPHPMTVVRPESAPLAVSTLPHRLELIAARGVDATLVLTFTTEVSRWTPEEFVRRVLFERLHAREVHVGENFRFGHRAAGTVETLRELGASMDFEVCPVPLVGAAERWSSSAVRAAVAEGDVPTAAESLGREHRVEGPVVEGDKRGRELGYPTANLDLDKRAAVPADGIYAGWLIRASGEKLPAAVSIGTNPTFGGVGRRVEAYVLDRDDLELYGEHVAVEFTRRLRDTVRFDDVDALLAQMAIDVDQAREILVGR